MAVVVVAVVVVAAVVFAVAFVAAMVFRVAVGVVMPVGVAGVVSEVGVVMGIASGHVVSASSAVKAMGAPAMTVAPVMPGTYAEEDSVIEVAGSVEADRRTGVRRIVEVSVGADRRRAADDDCRSPDRDGDLSVAIWHNDESG